MGNRGRVAALGRQVGMLCVAVLALMFQPASAGATQRWMDREEVRVTVGGGYTSCARWLHGDHVCAPAGAMFGGLARTTRHVWLQAEASHFGHTPYQRGVTMGGLHTRWRWGELGVGPSVAVAAPLAAGLPTSDAAVAPGGALVLTLHGSKLRGTLGELLDGFTLRSGMRVQSWLDHPGSVASTSWLETSHELGDGFSLGARLTEPALRPGEAYPTARTRAGQPIDLPVSSILFTLEYTGG